MKRYVRLKARAGSGLVLALAGFLAACGTETVVPPAPSDPVGESAASIIGGFAANSASLNAIGTLGSYWQGQYDYFCTATLIDPTTVITAKHCALLFQVAPEPPTMLIDQVPVHFAIGPNAWAPVEIIEANGTWVSSEENGGMYSAGLNLGNDVAVFKLIRPVTSVKPIPVELAPLTAADLGAKFVSIGFGINRNPGPTAPPQTYTGTRRMGAGTLRALSGLYFQNVFGSLASFLAKTEEAVGRSLSAEDHAALAEIYNQGDLLPGYDAWVGHQPGDVQPCYGDSGSPLIRAVTVTTNGVPKSELRVFGVVSGGWFSKRQICDYGTWYALIGSKTKDLVSWATGYQDPCLGTTTRGTCSGTVATRCTLEGPEGERRKSVVDCEQSLQVCGLDSSLNASCLDAPPVSAPPKEVSGAEKREELFKARWGRSALERP